MKQKGILVVISGFSGAGKGTLVKRLLEEYENYALSISMTTRLPRPGEENGRAYFFVTKEEFEDRIRKDGLIEYASYLDQYYGTPREYVENRINEGMNVILEIEIQGALKIKKKYPDALLLFVMPPSAKELKRRLEGRGTEQPDVIYRRLNRAAEEAEGVEEYEYLLVNDDLELCVKQLHSIILAARNTPSRNVELIETIRQELKVLVKGEM